jgi:hypothetical protein
MALVNTAVVLPETADFALCFTITNWSENPYFAGQGSDPFNGANEFGLKRADNTAAYIIVSNNAGGYAWVFAASATGNRVAIMRSGAIISTYANAVFVDNATAFPTDAISQVALQVDNTTINPATVALYTTGDLVNAIREDWAVRSGRKIYSHPVTDWLSARLTALSATSKHVYRPPQIGDSVLVDLSASGYLHAGAVNGAAPAAKAVPIVGWPQIAPAFNGTNRYSFGAPTMDISGYTYIAAIVKAATTGTQGILSLGRSVDGSGISLFLGGTPLEIIADMVDTGLDERSNITSGSLIADGGCHLVESLLHPTGHAVWVDGKSCALTDGITDTPSAFSAWTNMVIAGIYQGGSVSSYLTGYVQPLAIATGVTWTSELSRLLYDRCVFAGLLV